MGEKITPRLKHYQDQGYTICRVEPPAWVTLHYPGNVRVEFDGTADIDLLMPLSQEQMDTLAEHYVIYEVVDFD